MKELIIDSEFRDLIPPLDETELKGLEEDILRDGVRHAITVWQGTIVDGHNRYVIAQKHRLPFKTEEMQFDDRDAAKIWIIRTQLNKRNVPPPVRIKLALLAEPLIAAEAKKRQGTRNDLNLPDKCLESSPVQEVSTSDDTQTVSNIEDKCPQSSQKSSSAPKPKNQTRRKNETNFKVAEIAKVSDKTVQRYKKIQQDGSEEIKAKVDRGEISINEGYNKVKRAEKETKQEGHREENATKIETLATPLDAQGLFQTIVIDPPWDWGDEGDVNQFGRAKPEYSTMPFADIKALPINKIADANCHLYLWVTNRSLPKAFALIEAWGFRYITCLTWCKPSIGMGNYFRGSTEQILFAVKGSQPLKRHDVGTYFNAPRGDKHSAKPDEFYQLVESCSYAPFIDVFGRKERDGWSVWGENG